VFTAAAPPECQDANVTKLSSFVSERHEKCRWALSSAAGERERWVEGAKRALFGAEEAFGSGDICPIYRPKSQRTTLASTWDKNDCSYMMQDHLYSYLLSRRQNEL
jgi:hypothetical protein